MGMKREGRAMWAGEKRKKRENERGEMSKIEIRQAEKRRKAMREAWLVSSSTAGYRGRHEKEASEEDVCSLYVYIRVWEGEFLSI